MALPLRVRQDSTVGVRDRRQIRPLLEAVPGRRRFARFAVALTVMIGAVMIGAVLLHTRLAERQLIIDDLNRSLIEQREEFDVLRAQRAELRSPNRLAVGAGALGMVPGTESEFVDVDPALLAVTIARTGELPAGEASIVGTDARWRPLDQYELVKSLDVETP